MSNTLSLSFAPAIGGFVTHVTTDDSGENGWCITIDHSDSKDEGARKAFALLRVDYSPGMRSCTILGTVYDIEIRS